MPRAKRTDKVPHPYFPAILVPRYVAEAWNKSAEERAAESQRVLRRRLLTPKLDELVKWGVGKADRPILDIFQRYDEALLDGRLGHDIFGPLVVWGNYTDSYRQDDGRMKEVQRYMQPEPEDLDRLVSYVMDALDKLDNPKPKRPPSAPAPSTDALRKRRARAEGRVKPRPNTGPQTIEQRLASREKALATRRRTLAELHPLDAGGRLRCEEGIRREEKAIATLRARLVAN